MSQQESLLQAILADPDDDHLRLVYADWLEEHGNADRAEFIRVQIELARSPPEAPSRHELLRREKELLETHRAAWLKELPPMPSGTKLEFQRGFVHRVTFARAARFSEHAGKLSAAAPIQELRIGKLLLEHLPELAESPLLARLSALLLEGNPLDEQSVQRLVASPHLVCLTRLHLIDSAVGDGAIRALAASPCRTTLSELDVSWNSFGDMGVAALAAVPWPRLTHLNLAHSDIGIAGARALARSRHLCQLTQLNVAGNSVGLVGAAALVTSPSLERLTALNFAETRLGHTGVERLAVSPQIARLRKLDLGANGIGDRGARALLASPHLAGLDGLNVLPNVFGQAAHQALAQRFGDRLRALKW
jgi:uncharacterized protein (TIGR02996 family)